MPVIRKLWVDTLGVFFSDAGVIHSRRLHDKNFFIGPTMQPV